MPRHPTSDRQQATSSTIVHGGSTPNHGIGKPPLEKSFDSSGGNRLRMHRLRFKVARIDLKINLDLLYHYFTLLMHEWSPSMPSADHDLCDDHSARRQSFCLGKSIYNALNNNSLSQFLFIFTMALSISIILCMIIAAASANIRLERRYLCGHPILRPALLALDDRAEAGLSKEPWFDPVRQGLTEIGAPRCSGWAAIMVDRLSCCSPLLASC